MCRLVLQRKRVKMKTNCRTNKITVINGVCFDRKVLKRQNDKIIIPNPVHTGYLQHYYSRGSRTQRGVCKSASCVVPSSNASYWVG